LLFGYRSLIYSILSGRVISIRHFVSPFMCIGTFHSSRFSHKKKKRDVNISLLSCFIKNNGLFTIHSLLELVYTSAGINKLLLASVEWMALRTDIDMKAALSGCGLKCLAACALYSDCCGLRMYCIFHYFHLSSKGRRVFSVLTHFDTYAKPDLYVQIKCYYSLDAVSTIILCCAVIYHLFSLAAVTAVC